MDAPEPVAAPEPVTITIDETLPEPPFEDDEFDDLTAAPTIPPRQVDPDALDVLRKEAEHEQELRRAEAAQAQSTPRPSEPEEVFDADDTTVSIADEVIDPASKEAERAAQARERMARLRGIEPDEPEKSGSRSELLPDIDEINSTLRAESERQKEAATNDIIAPISAAAERKRGFRLGFGTSLLIVGILTGAYVYAPLIVRSIPATEPVLVGYVRVINEGRGWLERGMQGALNSLGAGSTDATEDSAEPSGESQG